MSDGARPWDPEIELTPERAAHLIAGQFPGLGTKRVVLLGRGWDNSAFLTEDDIVFRFPRKATAALLLETEADILPVVAPRVPLAVPVPEWRGRPCDAFPWTFLGYRRLAGRPASEAGPGVADRVASAPGLGRFLAALHAIRPLPAGLPGDLLDRRDVLNRLPLMIERLETLRARGVVPDTKPLLDLFDRLGDVAMPAGEALVHGDLYARHLLVDDERSLTGVIDWGDVHAGDVAMDLMLVYGFLPAVARPAFFEVYGRVDEGTLRRARLRAVFHAVSVTWYGLELRAEDLLREGRLALRFVLEDG